MTIKVMKQALEALECIESPLHVWEINKIGGAMNALREAIEFAEMVKKGTKAWADTPDDWVDDLRGEAEPVAWTTLQHTLTRHRHNEMAHWRFNQALPKQEPVAFRNTETGEFCTGGFLHKDWAKWQPLYAAPREWIGLTDEEVGGLTVFDGLTHIEVPILVDFVRAIEAKLKEKNHG